MTTIADLEAALADAKQAYLDHSAAGSPTGGHEADEFIHRTATCAVACEELAPRLLAFVRSGDAFRVATRNFLKGATDEGDLAIAALVYDKARAALERDE